MPDEEDNLGDSPDQPAKGKGRAKSLILFLLLAGLVAWGAVALSSKRRATPETAGQQVKQVLHLDEFVVNLADRDSPAFLRIGIDVGQSEAHKSAAGSPNPVPAVRDTILSVVSAYKADDLLTAAGKTKLKQELVASLQQRVPAAHVVEVYFTEFLVQH